MKTMNHFFVRLFFIFISRFCIQINEYMFNQRGSNDPYFSTEGKLNHLTICKMSLNSFVTLTLLINMTLVKY